jgi:polysaccharide biosynthesis/export protein
MKSVWHFNVITIFIVILFSSCASTEKAIYLGNIGDTEFTKLVDDLEPVIQKNDLLSISVTSPNPTASQYFNSSTTITTQSLNYTTTQATGFLVNQDGYIEYPMLGKIKAAGLRKKQLKEKIAATLVENRLLLDPLVTVRYLNFKVTVLGEVAHPAVLNVPDEKISLLQALGLAGDMTMYAKRDNVMILREEDGKRTVKRLNLLSTDILTSPYYYLKSNDVVYVEPNQAKASSTSNAKTWLPAILSALSFTVVILDHIYD